MWRHATRRLRNSSRETTLRASSYKYAVKFNGIIDARVCSSLFLTSFPPAGTFSSMRRFNAAGGKVNVNLQPFTPADDERVCIRRKQINLIFFPRANSNAAMLHCSCRPGKNQTSFNRKKKRLAHKDISLDGGLTELHGLFHVHAQTYMRGLLALATLYSIQYYIRSNKS